ncbi:MAG: hypothetical protein O6852_09845 [Gammaproteobacteria bacterium]|nr:hypothetical protein [Gammaproteobacteria bacterium]
MAVLLHADDDEVSTHSVMSGPFGKDTHQDLGAMIPTCSGVFNDYGKIR